MKSFSVGSAGTVSVNGDWSDIEEDTEDMSSNWAATTKKSRREQSKSEIGSFGTCAGCCVWCNCCANCTAWIDQPARYYLWTAILFTIQISCVVTYKQQDNEIWTCDVVLVHEDEYSLTRRLLVKSMYIFLWKGGKYFFGFHSSDHTNVFLFEIQHNYLVLRWLTQYTRLPGATHKMAWLMAQKRCICVNNKL